MHTYASRIKLTSTPIATAGATLSDTTLVDGPPAALAATIAFTLSGCQ